ncbi:porin [Flavobacteriaceae bacterium F89]|uniref:Porin n=1 Tax=Cerina litoralis TaxID=2874477 RepID=A0AAE3ER96_9FLAO|nr:outer membrane beta-barrel protein [Cerina litoralis]MCG2459518.1 porin [Cerina litoralis]
MKTIITTNYVKITFLLTFIMTTVEIFAQEPDIIEEPKPRFAIGGSVDAYYRTNLSATDKAIFGEDGDSFLAPATSFANQTGFALGMANVIGSYEGVKTGAVADLVFGPRGEQAVYGLNLNQLYAYWNVAESVKLTLGRFNTFLGYEVISPVSNFNYSTSYLFSSGPFSNTGLRADFSFSEDFSLMLAFMNVTDEDYNFTGEYSIGAQLGYKGQFLNLYYDAKAKLGFEVDYTGGFSLTDALYLGLNAAYADNHGTGFGGVAVYPQYSFSDSFGLGLRGEYFAQHIEMVDDDPSVFAVTVTGSYKLENLTIKPELRLDSGSDAIFFDYDMNPSKSLSSFLLAAIYSF